MPGTACSQRSPLSRQADGDSAAAEACLTRLLEYGAHSKESARSAMDQLRSALGSAATPVRPDTPPSR